MERYRSLQTIEAVQFTGTAIPDVTCHGTPEEVTTNGCDSSRKQHPHVHTKETGGMHVLIPGDWIYPVSGGPWAVATDALFRASWEVPGASPSEEQPETASAPDSVEQILSQYGLPPIKKIRKALTAFETPAKTLDQMLAEAGLPSAEEIQAVIADEAAGKVLTPESPVGVDAVSVAAELKNAIPNYEVRHYSDGTTASGPGPLPEVSPTGAPAVSTVTQTSVQAGPGEPAA